MAKESRVIGYESNFKNEFHFHHALLKEKVENLLQEMQSLQDYITDNEFLSIDNKFEYRLDNSIRDLKEACEKENILGEYNDFE